MAIIYGTSVKELCAKVAERITAALAAGTVPWICPYKRQGGPPFNVFRRVRANHKQPYTGINRFLLELTMWEKGWPSPAFLTVNQLRELNPGKDPDGPRLLRTDGGIPLSPQDWKEHGQEPCYVMVFKPSSKWVKDGRPAAAGDPGAEEKASYFGRVYPVFNVAQCANLPPDIKEAAAVSSGEAKLECVPEEIMAAIENMKLLGGIVAADIPHYSATFDRIGMPALKMFIDEDAYLATLLHEAGHAAGNVSRVGREPRGDSRHEKIAAYAREELCAEMTSAMAMAAFGLPATQELQHIGYLQSYIELLKADPSILVWAASQAEKRTAYLVEKAREKAALEVAALAAAH